MQLNMVLIFGFNMEIRNDNDRRLWFRIKLVDKKINSLGKIGSKDFDWLKWEELTDESARLYSQLSTLNLLKNNNRVLTVWEAAAIFLKAVISNTLFSILSN